MRMSTQEIIAELHKLSRPDLERVDARLHELLFSNGQATRGAVLSQAQRISPKFAGRIEQLYNLENNWDGEGASAIRPEIVANAVQLVDFLKARVEGFSEPFAAPTFDGFLQLDWTNKQRSLEVQLTDTGLDVVGTDNAEGGRKYFNSEVSGNDGTFILPFYNWFARSDALWPSASR